LLVATRPISRRKKIIDWSLMICMAKTSSMHACDCTRSTRGSSCQRKWNGRREEELADRRREGRREGERCTANKRMRGEKLEREIAREARLTPVQC
jgi:hypothetical protein